MLQSNIESPSIYVKTLLKDTVKCMVKGLAFSLKSQENIMALIQKGIMKLTILLRSFFSDSCFVLLI